MLAAAEELIEVEAMRNITVSDEAFERLMTLSEKAGLITKPTVHRDDKGEITHLSRGHMWRVMGQGWTNPANSWVRVQGDDQHTLYHVYNILTGAVTTSQSTKTTSTTATNHWKARPSASTPWTRNSLTRTPCFARSATK